MWKKIIEGNFESKTIRKILVDKIIKSQAFWLLPERGDPLWIYETKGQVVALIRYLKEANAEIISFNMDLMSDAFNDLGQLKQSELNLWSAIKFMPEMPFCECIGNRSLGIFEPSAKERLNAKKNGAELVAILLNTSGSGDLKDKKIHPGFPKLMSGYSYNIKFS